MRPGESTIIIPKKSHVPNLPHKREALMRLFPEHLQRLSGQPALTDISGQAVKVVEDWSTEEDAEMEEVDEV
ncbi:hypothetical protein E1B28_005092 [Marasmius oreades]|uniref:Uncharacterized protein n=1 Tax=Marasmius oreades TaxID=181124 RepID=A0A9P7V017_9AGAR|nr:uncharacterized protein E1B28_005092 [Marasmius oreades]KAG7097772.1 hypothetical protein E1B28_005092 [Marasmius oreades]